jgi:hypothetical protein
MKPQMKGLIDIVNSQYNGGRMEDVWLDARSAYYGRTMAGISGSRVQKPTSRPLPKGLSADK